MDNNNTDSKLLGRRRTLQLFGVGLAAGTGLLAMAGCDKKDGGSTSGGESTSGGSTSGGGGANSCNTVPDETSKGLRKTLQYKAKAPTPEKKCSSCAQFQKGAYGDCGGCKLFTGPVQPEGVCLSYAPVGGEAGAAPTPG